MDLSLLGREADNVITSTAPSVISYSASSSTNSSNPDTAPPVEDKALEPGKPNLVNGEVEDDSGRYVIMFSLIGVSTVLVAAIIVGLRRR